MQNQVAWKNDCWLPLSEVSLGLDDVGLLQGVVVVDRLRTVASEVLDVALHCARFTESCRSVGISPPTREALIAAVTACAEKNRSCFANADFGIVVLATPGVRGAACEQPTWIVHATPIPWQRLASWYAGGQALRVSSHRNVPSACWSPSIKIRARLQYFLADQEALHASGDPNCGGVLLDIEGGLTETSTANLLVVEGRKLISPPRDSVLWGISLRRTLRLAEQAGYSIGFEKIPVERAKRADAILLTGTTAGIWTAACLDDRVFEHATSQAVYRCLADAWTQELQFDLRQQPQRQLDQ